MHGASGLSAGLAGVGLISSIFNLGISAYIASQVAKLHEKMDRIERKVDYIKDKVDRINTQVAENNLRHALNYVLQKAVSQKGVDLRILAGLRGDINKFTEELPNPRYLRIRCPLMLNFGLQLSSDIRGQLQQIHNLAYWIRKLIASKYNTSIDGDPERVITVNPDRDYFSIFGGGDLKIHVRATMHISNVAIKKTEWLNFDDYLPRGRSKQKPHQSIFKGKDPEQGLYDLSYGWLYQTDAGLLWRTWIELVGIVDGYENTFWPELKDAEPCGFNQIEVACDVPLLENA